MSKSEHERQEERIRKDGETREKERDYTVTERCHPTAQARPAENWLAFLRCIAVHRCLKNIVVLTTFWAVCGEVSGRQHLGSFRAASEEPSAAERVVPNFIA